MNHRRLVVLGMVAALVVAGCASVSDEAVPDCEPGPRLAILAQAVTDAAYVPCIAELPPGWSFAGLDVHDGGASLSLESDRADRDAEVDLVADCDVTEATPIESRAAGVRSYHFVETIDPRYAGRFFDVFPGGCVVTRYDFERGPHVALVTELVEAVGLLSRRELRRALDDDLGVTLDP